MTATAQFVLVTGLWICWCALHSLLISRRVLGWFEARLGSRFAGYRLFYVLFSVVTVAPLALYQFSIPQQLLFGWTGFWRVVQVMLLLYALWMFISGAKGYDLAYFVGWRQMQALRQR